ncbi:MAG: DUF2231 domain-containing protein [Leptospiraceae bacterium]
MDLPLHPVIVHFPVALTILFLILFPALLLWMGAKDQRQKAWVLVPALSLLLIVISYGALFTGEQDEELVEQVVSHEALEAHEHAAEYFFYFSWVPFLISLAGLKPWKGRSPSRWLTVLAQIGLVFFMLDAAHKGGLLVYKEGAARAHYEKLPTAPENSNPAESQRDEED